MRTDEPISPQELATAERMLLQTVAGAWNTGWQPRELARQVRRASDAMTAGLVLRVIAADHNRRAASTLDPRWIAQVDEMNLPTVTAGGGWLRAWARSEHLAGTMLLGAVIEARRALESAYPIQALIPPPGAQDGTASIINLTSKTDDPILNRVRALLAQAESTTFEAEAETFTAKAQELMTRHAIDIAMVAAGTQRAERPDTIRLPIDEPYVSAKSLLLHVVAQSSRCRAVFHKGLAMSSVVGFEVDLRATETLFTSLLVQAQVAMRAAASSSPTGTQARSRSFRSSFLMAYAHRVGERLDEINARAVADAEAETGRSILPVLAARSKIVDTTIDETFGKLGKASTRGGLDPAGWASGRIAADRAKLNAGDLPDSARALPQAGRATR